jgi:hypothetical protein
MEGQVDTDLREQRGVEEVVKKTDEAARTPGEGGRKPKP